MKKSCCGGTTGRRDPPPCGGDSRVPARSRSRPGGARGVRCARSPPSQPRTEGRQMAKPPSLTHAPCELSHLCSGCHLGVVGWAGRGKGEGNPVGAFAWLLSLLSPQSPESPPPSQAQNRKEGSRGCSFRRTARRPPPPPAGSLPPLSESISRGLPLVPQKLQLVGWGEDFSGDILPASRSPGRSDFPRETGIRLPRSRK